MYEAFNCIFGGQRGEICEFSLHGGQDTEPTEMVRNGPCQVLGWQSCHLVIITGKFVV